MVERPKPTSRTTGPICARCAHPVAPCHGVEVGRKYYHKNCGKLLQTNHGFLLFSPCPVPPAVSSSHGCNSMRSPQPSPKRFTAGLSKETLPFHSRWLTPR